MSRAFENDPRLKHMDPGKLSALQSLAKELLIQILMEGMSGEERKKAEAVRKLAGRMQKNRPGA